MLDLLIEQFAQSVFGDSDEVRWVELDMAFLNGLKACGYSEAEANRLFNVWITCMDHENPQPLEPDEQAQLAAAIEKIVTYRQRLN